MLADPIDVQVEEAGLDFERAKEIAGQKASEVSADPMLVAWFDRTRGAFSPPVECGGKAKPAWLVYAETRGADLVVSVNRETFVFVYLR